MQYKTERIQLNNVDLALQRGGSGPPLVYLHGTDGLSTWPEILDRLAERYTVIVPSHPGFGDSPCPDGFDDVSDLAYLYLDLFDQMDLRDISVVGHSLGGWVALECAVRNATRFRNLALIASAGIHVSGLPKTDIFMIDPDEQARLAYADRRLGEEAAACAQADKYQDLAIRERIASARFGWNPRFHNPRLSRWLHRINVRTLIIWGEEDRIYSPKHGPALQTLIPGAKLEVIPSCGHLPHVEQLDATLDALHAFWKD